MANKKPAYILKDCTSSIAGEHQIAQNQEITVPIPVRKTESMRMGGMIKPRKVFMGYEELSTGVKLVGLDPKIFKLYGYTVGSEIPVFHYGYMQSENGQNHSAVYETLCTLESVGVDGWVSGQAAQAEAKFDVNSAKLTIDGEVIFEIDDFKLSVGGVDVMPGRAEALRLA